jgi:ubiquinone/menaquinone biosynthesis C-methylase UbiE
MEKIDTILEKVALLKPETVLDVGCGCGSFTVQLSPYCGSITAIDFSQALIDRCKRENQRANVDYVCMDGRNIKFPDYSFDLVLERDCLHHILEWQKALDEMIRVSSGHILVQEPLDDLRSEEKRNTMRAQELILELQREVGYNHFKYIPLNYLIAHMQKRDISYETNITRRDEPVDFDEYFSSFGDFAEKSSRKEYWFKRLRRLRQELDGRMLCKEDILFIMAVK